MSQRGLIIGLAVSLTVNVFVVGAIVGAGVIRHRIVDQRARPPQQQGNPMLRFADRLPQDVRGPYVARIRQEAEAGRPQMQAARQARMEAAKLIGAETYDPVAAAAALDRARTAETTARAAMENAVVDAAKGLKQADRQLIAQSLRGPGPGGGGRRGGPDGRGLRGGFGPGGPGGPDGGFGPPRDGPAPIEIVPPSGK